MKKKRFKEEQIVRILKEAASVGDIRQTCRKHNLTEQTFYRWRSKYGALKEDEAIRLKTLEQENARLKRIVAEQALDISMLKDVARGNF